MEGGDKKHNLTSYDHLSLKSSPKQPGGKIEDPTSVQVVGSSDERSKGLGRSAKKPLYSKDDDSSEGFGFYYDTSSDSSQDPSSDNGPEDDSPNEHKNIMAGDLKNKMVELDKELSTMIGLENLKEQVKTWAKGMLLDYNRRSVGIKFGFRSKSPPHIAFLGNPGTGKTTVARMMGKILNELGILSSKKVVEVQRTDLVGRYVGSTGLKTKNKITEAKGGILFVDEAYRLIDPSSNNPDSGDYGKEALDEIMSVMENGKVSVIFAGYTEPMQSVLDSNQGLRRRMSGIFNFDNFTCEELAKILHLKPTQESHNMYGVKLDPSCTIDAIAEIIKRMTSEELRSTMNAGLVDHMLTKAIENLDKRLDCDCKDENLLATITLQDLEASLVLVNKNHSIGFEGVGACGLDLKPFCRWPWTRYFRLGFN